LDEDHKMFSGYQACPLVKNNRPRFRGLFCLHHKDQILMMETEMVPETLVTFKQLTRLIAGEDFINFSRRESFESCMKILWQ
jgi:hypothetical protein